MISLAFRFLLLITLGSSGLTGGFVFIFGAFSSCLNGFNSYYFSKAFFCLCCSNFIFFSNWFTSFVIKSASFATQTSSFSYFFYCFNFLGYFFCMIGKAFLILLLLILLTSYFFLFDPWSSGSNCKVCFLRRLEVLEMGLNSNLSYSI